MDMFISSNLSPAFLGFCVAEILGDVFYECRFVVGALLLLSEPLGISICLPRLPHLSSPSTLPPLGLCSGLPQRRY